MPLTNLNIPSASSDVVGVFDQNFNQIFPLARPVKCFVDEEARAMEHPREDGSVTTDNIIFQPNEIELQTILPPDEYRSVYAQIKQIYRAATILSVQTRATTYSNMFIYHIPHVEDTDLFNTISLSIRLRQAIIVQTTTQSLPASAVANPVNQSTINNGLQQPSASLGLPPPETFGPLSPLGLKAPPGIQLPAPNQNSYDNYPGTDLPTAPLTTDQIKQIITSKGFPKIDQ